MYKCDHCGNTLKTEAIFDERTEMHFCDEHCLEAYLSYYWDELFDHYLKLYTYHVCF